MKYLKGMPRAALAAALVLAVGLAGTIGTANAGTITNMTIWNASTPGDPTGIGASQKALPGNPIVGAGNLQTTVVDAVVPGTPPINFFVPTGGGTTIGAFLTSGGIANGGALDFCNGTCAGKTISTAGFGIVSLFKIVFTAPTEETFTLVHDDGVSLFAHGDTVSDLFPTAAADPTASATISRHLFAGSYDLWYVEANGLPAVLQATEIPVPEPATMFLGGLGLIAFGYAARRRLFGR